MKECGWKIYVHQHFFFSPNNNHLSPKMMVDLGENRMAAGRKNQSCPSVHPSINHILQPTWQKGAKMQKISVKERLKRLEAQREEMRKAEPPVIHMTIIHVLDDKSSFGGKGEYLRLFLDEARYKKAREEETSRHIEIIRYSRVKDRYLVSWGKERVREI